MTSLPFPSLHSFDTPSDDDDSSSSSFSLSLADLPDPALAEVGKHLSLSLLSLLSPHWRDLCLPWEGRLTVEREGERHTVDESGQQVTEKIALDDETFEALCERRGWMGENVRVASLRRVTRGGFERGFVALTKQRWLKSLTLCHLADWDVSLLTRVAGTLRSLELRQCTVKPVDFASIGRLSHLRCLIVKGGGSGTARLRALPLGHLRHLKQLETLEIDAAGAGGGETRSLRELRHLTRLRSLTLRGGHLDSTAARDLLLLAPTLSSLAVGSFRRDDDLAVLLGLPHLRSLSLGGIVSADGYGHLGLLTQLRDLVLWWHASPTTAEALAGALAALTGLVSLSLSPSLFVRTSLPRLPTDGDTSALSSLTLRSLTLTADDAATLASLPHLKSLVLRDCAVNDELMSIIVGGRELQSVRVEGSHLVTNAFLAEQQQQKRSNSSSSSSSSSSVCVTVHRG